MLDSAGNKDIATIRAGARMHSDGECEGEMPAFGAWTEKSYVAWMERSGIQVIFSRITALRACIRAT